MPLRGTGSRPTKKIDSGLFGPACISGSRSCRAGFLPAGLINLRVAAMESRPTVLGKELVFWWVGFNPAGLINLRVAAMDAPSGHRQPPYEKKDSGLLACLAFQAGINALKCSDFLG